MLIQDKFKNKNSCLIFEFIFLTILIFAKILLFHFQIFETIFPYELSWKYIKILEFYGNKLLISLFFASAVFLFRKRYPIVLILLFIDVWSICNSIYYNSNELFIDLPSIFTLTNLNGFWSSIIPLLDWKDILYPLLTILYYILSRYLFCHQISNRKFWLSTISVCCVAYFLFLVPDWVRKYYIRRDLIQYEIENKGIEDKAYEYKGIKLLLPFYENVINCTNSQGYKPYNVWSREYIYKNSIVDYFFSMLVYDLCSKESVYPVSDTELNGLITLTNLNSISEPQRNLIIILVESLESWALVNKFEGQEIMPNLMRFISENSNHMLMCDSITSQIRNGVSGDGQMIVSSGLLPISNGTACMLKAHNLYPNFNHFYKNSLTISPSTVWNQKQMSKNYQYNKCIFPITFNDGEKELCDTFTYSLDTLAKPFSVLHLTIATHIPFDYCAKINYNTLQLDPAMPNAMSNYLKCLNYTDVCLQDFFQMFKTNKDLQNSVIVITGDHTIFREKGINKFRTYAEKKHLRFSGQNFTSLIVYSPEIEKSIQVDEVAYQMDIFPTILYLIGKEDYPWKGFGVNLTDSIERNARPYTQEDAYRISEYLFQNDYFKQYENILN